MSKNNFQYKDIEFFVNNKIYFNSFLLKALDSSWQKCW